MWLAFAEHLRESMEPTSRIDIVEELDRSVDWFQSCKLSSFEYADQRDLVHLIHDILIHDERV